MRLVVKVVTFAALLAALYGLAVAVVYAAYRQSPARITRFMARVPPPVMRALPSRTLWMHARDGALGIGDPAPDFDLATFDRSGRVRLSSFRDRMPVALVFGSYT